MKRFFRQIAPLLISFAVVGGMSLFVRYFAKQGPDPFDRLIVETLPEVPELHGWPESFIQRLDRAHNALVEGEGRLDALVELARLYHANGFIMQAQSCYLGLESAQPDNAEWPYLLAVTREDYHDHELAIRDLQRSLSLDPPRELAYLRLGAALLGAGRLEEARSAFRFGMEVQSNDAWALIGLARVEISSGNFTAGERLLLEAIAADASLAEPYELLPGVYQELGEVDKAKRYRAAGAGKSGLTRPDDESLAFFDSYCYDTYALRRRADRKTEAGEMEAASELLLRAYQLDSDSAETLLVLSDLHFANDPLGSEVLLKAGAAFPFSSVVEAEIREDRWEQAERVARAYVKAEPENAAAHSVMGRIWDEIGEVAEAEQAYEKALALDPTRLETALRLGLLLLDRNPGRGIEMLNRYIEKNPDEPHARVALGLHFASEGAFDSAVENFDAAWRVDASFPGLARERSDALMNLGLAKCEAGRTEEGWEHFEAALRGAPEDEGFARRIAGTLIAKGFPELARRVPEVSF